MDRVIIRTTSNLSFSGTIAKDSVNGLTGVMLKPSSKSNLSIFCPYNEINCIVLPDGDIIKGDFDSCL